MYKSKPHFKSEFVKVFFTEIGNCTQSNSVCKNLVNADNFIINGVKLKSW